MGSREDTPTKALLKDAPDDLRDRQVKEQVGKHLPITTAQRHQAGHQVVNIKAAPTAMLNAQLPKVRNFFCEGGGDEVNHIH